MTEFIEVRLIEAWINDLQSILEQASLEPKPHTDLVINQGMRHGIDQIRARLNTWLQHQENMKTLSRSGEKLLITKDVNLSQGRYRKLEWYENDLFLTLAWRHGMNEEVGELMLEMQHVQELSTTYLVYEGDLSFDELASLARGGGLDSIKNEETQGEWVKQT